MLNILPLLGFNSLKVDLENPLCSGNRDSNLKKDFLPASRLNSPLQKTNAKRKIIQLNSYIKKAI